MGIVPGEVGRLLWNFFQSYPKTPAAAYNFGVPPGTRPFTWSVIRAGHKGQAGHYGSGDKGGGAPVASFTYRYGTCVFPRTSD